MREKTYFIIDFDSTFVSVEALEELARIAVKKGDKGKKIIERVKKITLAGMEGKISFTQSLRERLKLFKANKKDLEDLIKLLKKKIKPSISRNKEFFKKYRDYIYIVSGGFKEYIWPVVRPYGLKYSHILANRFIFDKKGEIIGFDEKNFLAQEGGKVKQVKALNLKGKTYVIGDGFTDFQIKAAGLAERFYGYIENVKRDLIVEKADYILPSFDEFLYLENLPQSISYPKNRIKVLWAGAIVNKVINPFIKEGYRIERIGEDISKEELKMRIRRASILVLNKKMVINKKMIDNGKQLLVVLILEKGLETKVDLIACLEKGTVVFSGKGGVQRVIDFMNNGCISHSLNFPGLKLRKKKRTHRFIHIYKNNPGVLAQINRVLAENNIIIEKQYLKTTKSVGYMITDINKKYNKKMIQTLKNIPETIKLRILY